MPSSRSKRSRPATSGNGSQRAPLGNANAESDADRIARLEAALEQMKEVNEALRAERPHAPAPQQNSCSADDDFILRPSNASKVKMGDLQDMLGVDDLTWNGIHTCTRDALSAARPDYNRNWKAQKPEKFAKAYNAIEEKFPVLRRCEGQWGVDRIAKQTWSNRKSYQNCLRNSSSYVARRAAARRGCSPIPPASPTASPRRSPSMGPSAPSTRRPAPRRITSSDLDEDDGFVDIDDDDAPHGHDGDGDDGGLDPADPKGKKRAAPQDGSGQKRSRRS